MAAALALGGCDLNPFTLGGGAGGGDGGAGGDGAVGDGGGNDSDGGVSDAMPPPDACIPTQEVCDEVDNDCDTMVDEGFDLDNDPANCGACGTTCALPGASGTCDQGSCTYECQGGFHDLNMDLAMMGSNGCEYGPCFDTGGGESCNVVDDDCDGTIDEDIQGLDSDPMNCGACFNQCIGVNVDEIICDTGTCSYTACLDDTGPGGVPDGVPDYADLAPTPAGCEYQCPVTPPLAQEECNAIDDDCDGAIDELPIDGLGDDCYPAGQAGCTDDGMGNFTCAGVCATGTRVCSFGVPVCQGSTLPQPAEVCDGVDHDCDGDPRNGFDTDNDPDNCGDACIVCDLDNAVEGCSAGTCVVAGCLPGFVDANGIDSDGCEYACTPTGDEVCDGADNDCDESFDEGLTPPVGLDCDIAGTMCTGVAPVCSDCAGVTSWRCDYSGVSDTEVGACGELVFQETLCDTFDNDCDGITDESYPVDPASPASDCDDGEVGACRDLGKLECDPSDPSAVICNATDDVPFPGTDEECNAVDDDCDGQLDEDITWDTVPIDADGDLATDYYIFTYEASRPDATLTASGVADHVVCSRGGALPWRSVTHTAAADACAAIGMRLCTTDEWLRACEGSTGTRYPYGNTYDGGACNGFDYDSDCTPPNDHVELLPTGYDYECPLPNDEVPNTCISEDGVLDLSGNVKEWTATEVPAGSGSYAVRGGAFDNIASALTCDNDFLTFDAANAFPNLGFRCCSDTAP